MAPPFYVRLTRLFALVFVVGWGVACSPADRYGSQVRYAPSFRAYVLAADSGSDDPPTEDAIVLRDPITQRKIRCREHLDKWADAYRQDAIDRLHDEAWEIASPILMAPATVVAALALDVLMVSVSFAELPYQMARSEDGTSLHEKAEEAFARDRWVEAARLFELALVRDGGLSTGLATYYVGIAYANQGRSDEAREALTAFVERSLAMEVTAYRNAERWLRWLDAPIEPCASQEPLEIAW